MSYVSESCQISAWVQKLGRPSQTDLPVKWFWLTQSWVNPSGIATEKHHQNQKIKSKMLSVSIPDHISHLRLFHFHLKMSHSLIQLFSLVVLKEDSTNFREDDLYDNRSYFLIVFLNNCWCWIINLKTKPLPNLFSEFNARCFLEWLYGL